MLEHGMNEKITWLDEKNIKFPIFRESEDSIIYQLNANRLVKIYKDSIGRSYYAMFSAIRAILALDKVDFSKHAGVIAYFQKEYVKTGKFDKEYSKYISSAFQIRNNCDYADFFLVSRNDAVEQYEKAEKFVDAVKRYLA